VYRAAAQQVERLESPGFWTGFVPDVEDMTEQHSFQLAADDVLLLYTDGLIEAKNTARVQYDMTRLEAALLRYGHLPVDAIKARIMDEVMAWLVTVDDDISIVVLKRQAGT
jgi:sigma-B regulation protein RsbU (phosphoserine phosphatase)